MPVVETTLIEGYDAETKARLMTGMARVVRSVMAAPAEGIVTIIREVAPSSYARGGVSRVPGPPLPVAAEVVAAFAAAVGAQDRDKAAALLAEEFSATGHDGQAIGLDGLLETAAADERTYLRFEEALADQTVAVFAEGRGRSPFIVGYVVFNGRITGYAVWGGD